MNRKFPNAPAPDTEISLANSLNRMRALIRAPDLYFMVLIDTVHTRLVQSSPCLPLEGGGEMSRPPCGSKPKSRLPPKYAAANHMSTFAYSNNFVNSRFRLARCERRVFLPRARLTKQWSVTLKPSAAMRSTLNLPSNTRQSNSLEYPGLASDLGDFRLALSDETPETVDDRLSTNPSRGSRAPGRRQGGKRRSRRVQTSERPSLHNAACSEYCS